MDTNFAERYNALLGNFNTQAPEPVRLELSPDEIRYNSLLIAMENQYISMRDAIKIVGGYKRLNLLIETNKIRGIKPEGARNRRWQINASDCYRNVRPRLKLLLKKQKISNL